MTLYSDLIDEAVQLAGFQSDGESRPGAGAFEADGLRFGWEISPDETEAVFFVSIGELPPDPPAGLCEYLLEQNCLGAQTAGGHIGLYAPTRVLLYSFRAPLTGTNAAGLANMLAAFVAKAPEYIRGMQSFSVGVTESTTESTTDMVFSSAMLWV